MKKIRSAFVLFAFLFLAMLGCSDQSQSPVAPAEQSSLDKAIITEYTISSSPAPFIADPNDYINIAGRTVHLMKYPVIDNVESSDARLTGRMEHVLTIKLDVITGEGPCNGKFTLTPTDLAATGGGVWEGTYEGYRSKTDNPYVFVLPLKMVAHGNGGTIDKIQGFNDVTLTVYTNQAYYPLPIYWTAKGTGFMIEH